MKWVKTLFWMIIFFLAIHFSIQNRDEVTLRYSFLNAGGVELPHVPLFLIILCSIFLGLLIGGIGDLYGRLKLKKGLRQSQKIIEKLEREIQSLRGPIMDQPSFLKEE
jgi:uncharacterized integral membrane protein